ncbi:MAG TPA: TonB-dependent receptor [Polyangiales bacterium]|nr:TonB-dependent receptor [Polyangiales bacterium]
MLCGAAPAAVYAQAEAPSAPAPVIKPPSLKQFVEAVYPPQALEQGLSARVEIELVIGVDGRVSDAKVKTPVGNGFDEAALAAARQLTFEPATRDGQPVAARVTFPYVFEWKAPEPPPEPAEPPPPAPARFEGQVLDASAGAPIAEVEVVISDAEGHTQRVVTDAFGKFAIPELPAGTYHVSVNAAEWTRQEIDETLNPGEATTVVYRLSPAPDPDAYHAVARVAPPPREVTRRTIGKTELTRIPGTRGDALRTVEILPGVARPPLGAGQLIVRGSAPADTQVFLDGVPVPLLYHFGGLTSFINSRLLESVDFYPGNFSVRYGRRRGGIVEARLSDPPRDQLHGVADLSLIDGSVLLQGPITKGWQFAAGVRRSWLDVVLGTALDSADINTLAAPVYYDYQVETTVQPDPENKLRLMAYGSRDSFALLFTQPADTDASIRGQFDLVSQFHRLQATWNSKVSRRVDHELEVAGGVYDVKFGVGEAFDFSLTGSEFYLRSEWRARATDRARIILGIDAAVQPAKVNYKGPPIGQSEGNPDSGNINSGSPSTRSQLNQYDQLTVVQPAVYFESDLDLSPLRFVLGARVDYYSPIERFSFDPRLSMIYSIDEDTRLKGGIGMFTQPPAVQESSDVFGNPKLEPQHTVHIGLGIERDLTEGFRVGVEGFYKHLYDRVIGTQFGESPYFVNGGKGRIYGLEVSAKVDPRGRFFGYLSYTLSRSERFDRSEQWEYFDFDQPHILTVSGTYRLGKGWEAGALFRLTSGNPDTPVVGAIYNKDSDSYSPVFGRINSIRKPLFHKLDIRIEKQWVFSAWKLALYLDVQNVYNAVNSESIVYDFEYRTNQAVRGLPILPNLGLRGEF